MNYILCNNIWEGVCFMMDKALKREELVVETKNSKDDVKFFKKYNIGTCPVLLGLDNDKECVRITGIQDIIKTLKDV